MKSRKITVTAYGDVTDAEALHFAARLLHAAPERKGVVVWQNSIAACFSDYAKGLAIKVWRGCSPE